jgi:hypothetical protein
MSPIRQGDGTGLSVPGFNEVRTGDGSVLYTAGSSGPKSVVDDFETLTDGDPVDTISQWQDPNNAGVATNSRAYAGSLSIESTLSSAGDFAFYSDFGGASFSQPFTLEFKYNEKETNSGFGWVVQNGAGQPMAIFGSSNPGVEFIDANGRSSLLSSPSPEYDTWRKVVITLNTDSTFDILWKDLGGSSTDQLASGRPMINPAQNVGRVGLVDRPQGESRFGSIQDLYIDDAERVA